MSYLLYRYIHCNIFLFLAQCVAQQSFNQPRTKQHGVWSRYTPIRFTRCGNYFDEITWPSIDANQGTKQYNYYNGNNEKIGKLFNSTISEGSAIASGSNRNSRFIGFGTKKLNQNNCTNSIFFYQIHFPLSKKNQSVGHINNGAANKTLKKIIVYAIVENPYLNLAF